MILLVEHYTPADSYRANELESVAIANVRLGAFSETAVVQSAARATYGKFFSIAAERWPGEICVIANADIQFDESCLLLKQIVRKGRLTTLTRWETDSTPRMIGQYKNERFYSGSQDAWAIIGGDCVGIGDAIPLGYIGCDNAIAGACMNAGYSVVDPALSIKARHVHASTGRGEGELVVTGTYAYPELTTTTVTEKIIYHQWPATDA